MRTSGDCGSSAGEMAPNREVASLVVVKMLGPSTRNLITGQQHPFLGKCSYILHQADNGKVFAPGWLRIHHSRI